LGSGVGGGGGRGGLVGGGGGGVLMGLVLVGVLLQWLQDRGVTLSVTGSRPSFVRSAWVTGLGAAALVVLGLPNVQRLIGGQSGTILASLQESRFNERDAELLDRGYYEGLLETSRFTTELWEAKLAMPSDWKALTESDLVRITGGIMRYELVPSNRTVYHRAETTTNQWGMRDRDYLQAKPPGTYRMALLGASYEMGSAVRDGESFEALVETRLNASSAGKPFERYEILNFAVGGYSVLQHMQLLDDKLGAFSPDMVLCTGHSGDTGRTLFLLAEMVQEGVPLPLFLDDLRQRSGIQPGMDFSEYRRLLAPFGDEILGWGYRQIVEKSRAMGATPLWAFVPRTDGIRRGEDPEQIRALAREAGFVVLDLEGAYLETDPRLLSVAPWDAHPNPRGHQLLADRLYQVLLESNQIPGMRQAGRTETVNR